MLHGLAAAHDLAPTSAVPQFVGYSAMITGGPNGESDYPITLTSFQAGLYSGSPSYASATMGYTLTALTELNARPDGELVVYQIPVFTDGAAGLHELARFNLDNVRYGRGARSSSITITASRQSTNTSPHVLTLNDASVVDVALQADGKYAITLTPVAAWPAPADTLSYGGHNYTVARVDYTFGASNRTLKITATRPAAADNFAAVELDHALALRAVIYKAVGMATEQDRAVPYAIARETDQALALVPVQSRAAGMATETDTAPAALTRVATFTGSIGSIFFNSGYWFIIVNNAGVKTSYFSSDRTTWTAMGDEAAGGSTNTNWIMPPTLAGGYWFAQRVSGVLVKSSNLTTWAAVTGIPAAAGTSFSAVASDSEKWVFTHATLYNVGTDNAMRFLVTADFATWNLMAAPLNITGGAPTAAYTDGLWFFAAINGAVTPRIAVTDDFWVWTTPLTGTYYLAQSSAGLYAVLSIASDPQASRYDSATDAFVNVAAPPNPGLFDLFASAAGGSLVTLDDNMGGWSDFALARVYTSAGWEAAPIGAPASPIVFTDDLWDWNFGDTGIMFASVDTGTLYLDFLDLSGASFAGGL